MAFEFFLAALQRLLIGPDCVETAADFRRFLCCHTAMFVEFNRIVSHDRLPFPARAVPISRSAAIEEHRKDASKARRTVVTLGSSTPREPGSRGRNEIFHGP